MDTMKVYYVSGLNFLDQPVTEKVMALNVPDARKKATKVASHAKVLSPKTAADRSKKR